MENKNVHATLESLLSTEAEMPPNQADANDKLDEREMADYLCNMGQWSKNVVSDNKPNL